MRAKGKKREAFSEHSYWQSYSDMMAALLLIFILMIAITLAIYKQKTTDLDNTRLDLLAAQEELDAAKIHLENSRVEIEKSNEELAASLADLREAYAQAALTKDELNNAYKEIENAKLELDNAYLEMEAAQNELAATKSELQDIVGIRTDIISALQDTLTNSDMAVDAQTGSITFSSDVLFSYNSSTLTADSKKAIKEIIPKYLKVLLLERYRPYIAEVIIEGHTDTDGGYASNMVLSFERANAVAEFCLDEKNGLSKTQIAELQEVLTVNGRSYSSPIYEKDRNGNVTNKIDMDASRRVEIKFRLKEDEMIKKIAEILEQQ
ncbi:MAG: hypothetical protein E7287_09350 [Lachnospiraceae bacterium]|nr:hypothetical protein [Lachnospiraceae bacterium]